METVEKKKIGKYEITAVLGRGGMGVVYRAEDKRIGRQVAIKTLTDNFSNQPEMLERFYREAQAGILQHPNIVIVFDLGDEDGVPFIVMEYVTGEPLDKLISSGRQLSIIEKLSIIEQVCSALGYAHQRGVVHRDIKPANVIVQPDGQAKIVDFGIARVQGSSSEGGLTRTGNVIGTIHYIAPERLRGKPFDGRSDIFAAGVMLYYMLAGQLPFTGEDMTVLQKLVNEPHPPLSTYLTGYPPQLDAIIDRALAKDPEQRYATAEEFAADLHGLGEQLKKGQIVELFSEAERFASEEQFGRAREVLLQLVRIDPQHTGARQLFGVVQQNLARLQRAEQVRQLVAEAEEAILSSRYAEAIGSFENALQLDPENAGIKTRLEEIREKKRRHDEIGSLMSQADSLKERGDWTGALRVAEKAFNLDQQDTKVRAIYAEISRQAKLAAQKEQIREMMGKARQELTSRRYTGAIEILREVGKLDPSLPEMETLLQSAVSGQEQERRRKLIDQIQVEIENCLAAEKYDRATELIERAVEQLPSESTLLQLKSRVALQTRAYRTRQLIETTSAKAQEVFLQAPGEALLIVQKALQELPGEERLLALEESLRQRLKAQEKEEVRGRYLREAQGAIDRSQFDKAIEVLESYQLEFSDAAGVGELLDYAKRELAQQQRRSRIGTTVSQARELLLSEQFDQAIQLLEPVCAETSDPTLARLLEEARNQRAAVLAKSEALMGQIVRHRERGQLDEAIGLLQALPTSSVAGSPQYTLLAEIRGEKARKEATQVALAGAAKASDLAGFHAAIESLQKVQRAWGDTPELSKAIAGIESHRTQLANQAVAKSVEAARAALLDTNPAEAIAALKTSTEWFEFAGSSQQADWKRLNTEAAKPVARRSTGQVPMVNAPGAINEAAPPRSKLLIPIIIGAVLAIAGVGIAVVMHKPAVVPPQPPNPADHQAPPAATTALLIQGSVDKGTPDGVQVFVDGALEGFTLAGGALNLPVDPGKHLIKFSKPGYVDVPASTITVAANSQAPLPFKLTQSATLPPPEPVAYLSIQSTPGAAVTIDNAQQGVTDAHGALVLKVQPGQRALGISLNGYQSYTNSFNLKNGAQQSIIAILTANNKPQPPPPPPPVQAVFSASSLTIQQGQSTTLNWQTNNATEVSIDNGVGGVSPSGQKEVSPGSNTTYVLTAKNNGGTQQASVAIIVTPKSMPPPPPPPTNTTPTPTAPTVDPSVQIQQAIAGFDAAYNAHDMGRIQSSWTGIKSGQAKALQDFFKQQPASKVSDNCPPAALTISGDTASWTCNETSTFNSGGKMISNNVVIHFTLAHKGDAWTIVGRQ